MKALCFTYNLGKELDLEKLAPVLDFTYSKKTNVLSGKIGEINTYLLPDGRMRLNLRADPDVLRKAITTASPEIQQIIRKIKEALNLKLDVDQIVASLYHEDVDEDILPALRPSFPSTAKVDISRGLYINSLEEAGEYQTERIATRAGDKRGRAMVRRASPKKEQELLPMIKKYIESNKIASVEYKPSKGEAKAGIREAIVTLFECSSAVGLPCIGRALCHFERGFIRGTYCQFRGLENIAVNELKCWGLGDTYCEFEIITYTV